MEGTGEVKQQDGQSTEFDWSAAFQAPSTEFDWSEAFKPDFNAILHGQMAQDEADLRGTMGGFLGSIKSSTGMMLESVGRLGEAMFSPPAGEFDDSATRMGQQLHAPGGMRQVGQEYKTEGQQYMAPERAAVQARGGLTGFTAKAAEAAGTSVPIMAAAAAGGPLGLVTGGAAGAAMEYTQFRDEAEKYAATPEDANLAGLIGAASGSLQAIPMMGPLARLLGRMPVPVKEVMATYIADAAKTAALEGGQEFTDQVIQNLTAKYWVGYDKDRKLMADAIESGALGAASSVLTSIVGIGGGHMLHSPTTAQDAPESTGPVNDPEAVLSEPGAVQGEPEAPVPNVPPVDAAPAPNVPPVELEAAPVATDAAPVAAETAPVTTDAPPVEPESPTPEQPPTQQPTEPASPEASKITAPDESITADSGAATEQTDSVPPATEKPAPTGDPSKLISIKNAAMDAERVAMGLEPATHGEKTTFEAEIAKAKETLDTDPTAGERLVKDLEENPRNITHEEDALLSVELVRLTNERDAASDALKAAAKSGHGIEAAQARVDKAREDYIRFSVQDKLAGTKQGQSLAFRKVMLRNDYSLAEMERAERDKKGGEPLTEAESKEIERLHEQIRVVTEAHDKLLAEKRAKDADEAAADILPAIKQRAKRNKARRVNGPVRERIAKEAAEARAFLKANIHRASSNPVDLLPALIKIGAEHISNGITEFAAWSEAIVGEVGERVRPQLEAAFEQAKAYVRQAQLEYLTSRAKDRNAAGLDIGSYASRIALHFVENGVTEVQPLIDAVHGVLKQVNPEITRDQARDAMSGYGKYRKLSLDQAKRKLADLKGQAQKLAQIEALEKKLIPLKTGFERVEPSPDQRELRRRVTQLRKEAGLTEQDPESALKTALQSKETSLRNRIADLQQEIDTRERTISEDRPSPTSPVTDALEAQIAELKKQHEEIFGKPGMSEEQRAQAAIKATQRAIAESERRIRERDFGPKPTRQGPPTEDVAKLHAENQALKAHHMALKSELEVLEAALHEGEPSAEEIRLQKQIDEFGKTKKRGLRQDVPTEKVAALRAELKRLQDERIAAKQASEPSAKERRLQRLIDQFGTEKPKNGPVQGPETESVVKLKAELQRLRDERTARDQESKPSAQELRLQKQIDEFGTIKPKRGEFQGPDTESVAKLKAELARLKEARKLANKKTPEQIATMARKAYLKRKIAEWMDKIARGDFEKRKPKKPVEHNPEVLDLASQEKELKAKWARRQRQKEYENRTRKQRVQDALKEILVGIPRSIKSSYDASAPFRQGMPLLIGTNPVTSARQIRKMFHALASEEYARRMDTEMRTDPRFPYLEAIKLEITSLDADLGPQEEAIRSNLAEKIPGIRPSNRGFITFLNLQRSEKAYAMLRSSAGMPSLDVGRDVASIINQFTGRGELGKAAPLARGLSLILWAPKLLASRFQVITASSLRHAKTAEGRKLIAVQYAKTLTGMAALYSLASLAGFGVSWDPRGSDFGKIHIGNTTLDPMAGLSQISTLLARVVTGQTKTGKGRIVSIRGKDKSYGTGVLDVTWRFLRSKFSPIVGSLANVAEGEDYMGEPATVKSELVQSYIPLSFGDVYHAMRSEGVPAGAALGVLGMLGMGIQTYDKHHKISFVEDIKALFKAKK